jgi:FlaA1/EpsC-like NDP-sugar epimerase
MNKQSIRRFNRGLLLFLDVVAVCIALLFAYLATLEGKPITVPLAIWAVGNLALALILFAIFGLYAVLFKSVGIVEMAKLVACTVLIAGANLAFVVFTVGVYVRLATAIVYVITLAMISMLIRSFRRLMGALRYHFADTHAAEKTRVMIVGGGEAGLAVIKEMQSSDKISYRPVCIARP